MQYAENPELGVKLIKKFLKNKAGRQAAVATLLGWLNGVNGLEAEEWAEKLGRKGTEFILPYGHKVMSFGEREGMPSLVRGLVPLYYDEPYRVVEPEYDGPAVVLEDRPKHFVQADIRPYNLLKVVTTARYRVDPIPAFLINPLQPVSEE